MGKEIFRIARAENSEEMSFPFLETYAIMAAILTFARECQKICIFSDSETAVNIFNKRWSKKNKEINKFIASFDIACTQRNLIVSGQTDAKSKAATTGRTLFSSRRKVEGRNSQPLKESKESYPLETALLPRTLQLMSSDI